MIRHDELEYISRNASDQDLKILMRIRNRCLKEVWVALLFLLVTLIVCGGSIAIVFCGDA